VQRRCLHRVRPTDVAKGRVCRTTPDGDTSGPRHCGWRSDTLCVAARGAVSSIGTVSATGRTTYVVPTVKRQAGLLHKGFRSRDQRAAVRPECDLDVARFNHNTVARCRRQRGKKNGRAKNQTTPK
jgi:hypothetical protein